MISIANTIVHKNTMVVKFLNAMIAKVTMIRILRS